MVAVKSIYFSEFVRHDDEMRLTVTRFSAKKKQFFCSEKEQNRCFTSTPEKNHKRRRDRVAAHD
jgi:hypothetical protein